MNPELILCSFFGYWVIKNSFFKSLPGLPIVKNVYKLYFFFLWDQGYVETSFSYHLPLKYGVENLAHLLLP